MRKKNIIINMKCLLCTDVWEFPKIAFGVNENNVEFLVETESRGDDE